MIGPGGFSWPRYAAPLGETQPCCGICGSAGPPPVVEMRAWLEPVADARPFTVYRVKL